MLVARDSNIAFTVCFRKGWTPLRWACERNRFECFEALVKMKADISKPINDYGSTALHAASEYGDLRSMKALVEANADLNAQNVNKQSPIHLAFQSGNTSAFLLLIELNADVNLPDRDGASILHLASARGDARLVKRLIEAGARMDVSNQEGMTPLHVAVQANKPESVETLCVNRASLNVLDLEKKTPLQRAIDSKSTQCIAALEGAGTLYSLSPVHDAAAKGKSSLIDSLVSEGANINDHDE